MASTALLATVADAKASQLAGGVAPVMPAGVILPFGGATAPTGWLVCDGSQVSRTQYADLFAAIGTAHGSGDGSSTFHLPDFRGRFLRGADGGAGRDPDKASRTAANSGGAVGDAVGSVQGNATKKNGLSASGDDVTTTVSGAKSQMNGGTGNNSANHNHYQNNSAIVAGGDFGIDYHPSFRNKIMVARDVAGTANPYHSVYTNNQSANHSHSWNFGTASFSASGTTSAGTISIADGDAETRPDNANVNYIIKV